MSQAILVAGLGFGDECKGATVDWLTRTTGAHTVIRYNGGAQAAHNVIDLDGRHHTFSQFGSGTFVPGVKTFLSRYMLVNPIAALSEGKHLESLGITDCYDRLFVDDRALVTTPFHVAANRIREMARDAESGRHGSCGMGIGETVADYLAAQVDTDDRSVLEEPPRPIYVWDLRAPDILRSKLEMIRYYKTEQLRPLHRDVCKARWRRGECTCSFSREWDVLQDEGTTDLCVQRYREFTERARIPKDAPAHLREILSKGTTIFEGAQGMLLDQDYGFHPYTTWTDITFQNAFNILEGIGYKGEIQRIGVLRSYMTRHGAGPFPTEDTSLNHPEAHNGHGPWQQGFRRGHFDLCLTRYALEAIGGVDGIAFTHADRIQDEQRICVRYDYKGHTTHEPTVNEMWAHRENLILREDATRKMMGYKPVYRTLRYTPEGFMTEIEKLLGVKILVRSYGPTANDRRT